MSTHIPLPVIQVPIGDCMIPTFDRFGLIPRIYTDPATPLTSLIHPALCRTSPRETSCFEFRSNVPDDPGFKRFALFHFNIVGVTSEMVKDSFSRAYIRPATLKEMLMVTSHHLKDYGEATVIALGSSNIQSPELSYSSMARLYRLFTSRRRHLKWLKSIETFPLMDWRNRDSHLRPTKGVGGWKSNYVFLGVVKNREFDLKLLDMKITVEKYLSLPRWNTLSGDFMSKGEIGTLFVYSDGTIRKLVKSEDMDVQQLGSCIFAGTPYGRGLIHYRPIFVQK
jgi:hypothetical protein